MGVTIKPAGEKKKKKKKKKKLPRDFTPITVNYVKIIGYFLTKPYRNKSDRFISLYKTG